MSEVVWPQVLLVGAGVVGRSIALDHLLAGIPVWMADRDADMLSRSCDWVLQRSESTAESAPPWGAKVDLPIVLIRPNDHDPSFGPEVPRWLLIESIAERLDVKQAFFADAEGWFERSPILTTNTSTLSIEKIASTMQHPERLCGLHFFMPVVDRHAAEIISSPATDPEVVAACCRHAERLAKRPLLVRDGPGFVVNRMLSSYLNLAMWLLCGGVDEDVIGRAAIGYGMPISPLELIDLIGPRTAFDGGRTVWQAFPTRMDPSPLLPALVKRKLTGVQGGRGFYTYSLQASDSSHPHREGQGITAEASELVERYRHHDFNVGMLNADELIALVAELFAATMHWEAAAIVRDGIADSETIGLAMREGLAWRRGRDLSSQTASPESVLSPETLQRIAADYPLIRSVQPIPRSCS
ncbi:3-hydroxyacyl-CoA dehydrogenase family protein [Neorhodopirellula pilleata]|uniref:Fatty acid oxidation complex subunit alpha n=1 Tax=Neorhodopirellula pilleata TaxID=2714738 RepID=A0A5C5ZG75_9BACT|nr:3-hydroxyacyl-CoA dehydrogenase family protein [Neorhodopirellula pilleata]TWT86130.1 Fatty acid oxidation complex subunit alpha [Neorhodopirellula pilleata]